jgi:hypothetical protein
MSDRSPGEPKRVTVSTLAESCVRAFDLLGLFDKPSSPQRQLVLGIAGGLSQVRRAIGQQLQAQYDVASPMPARLVELVRQVEHATANSKKDGNKLPNALI